MTKQEKDRLIDAVITASRELRPLEEARRQGKYGPLDAELRAAAEVVATLLQRALQT